MTALPTAGSASQTAAIIELHIKRIEPRRIAERLDVPVNNVNRAIWRFRQKTGRRINPKSTMPPKQSLPYVDPLWSMDEDKRRAAFARKAARGARAALEQAEKGQ